MREHDEHEAQSQSAHRDHLDDRPFHARAHELSRLLDAWQIATIADMRCFTGSRKYPQYTQQALTQALAARRIDYARLPDLGGRRRPLPDSPNTAWRNAGFRGYADYMSSAPFAQALSRVLEFAGGSRTALMCAESLWWRCHRALIADALCVRGIEVVHILDAQHSTVHPMTQPAHVVDGQLSYAANGVSGALF